MIAKVIAIESLPQSMSAAARCATSAALFGLQIEWFPAITDDDDPAAIMGARGMPLRAFTANRYSRPLPCMACFLSHCWLWNQCAQDNQPMIICEHDALMARALPELESSGHYLVNLCQPSFGKWKQPPCGIGPLVSKPHLPGATAYYLHPNGARLLLEKAATEAEPTDVFLSLKRFPFIRESFPYSFVCDQHFTTIQNPEGCRAKHQPVTII